MREQELTLTVLLVKWTFRERERKIEKMPEMSSPSAQNTKVNTMRDHSPSLFHTKVSKKRYGDG